MGNFVSPCLLSLLCLMPAVEVRTLLQFFGRGIYAVDDDTPLLELLKTFKQGKGRTDLHGEPGCCASRDREDGVWLQGWLCAVW